MTKHELHRKLAQLKTEIDPLYKLSAIEEMIAFLQVIVPTPNRKTLISMIEDGTWTGEQISGIWHVRESSFMAWVKAKQTQQTVAENSRAQQKSGAPSLAA